MASLETILKGNASTSAIQRSGAAAVREQPADSGEDKSDLNGSEQPEPEIVEQSKPEPVKTEEKPKAETPASSAEAKDQTTIPLATFKAVERRLQEAERRERERDEKAKPAPEVPDVLTDQEGFRKSILAENNAAMFDRAVAISEDFAKRSFQDFATVMGTDESGTHTAWIELAKTNRHLVDEFRNSPNPALFAYEAVKRHKAMNEIGDPLTFKERFEKELRTKWEADIAAKQTTRPEIPESLADEPSKAPRKAPEWSGPKPLKEIIGSKPSR